VTRDIVVISDSDDNPDNPAKIEVTYDVAAAPPHLSNRTSVCMGMKLDFPPGHSPYNSYPIAMHDANKLEWDLEFHRGSLYLCSWDCKCSVVAAPCCRPCLSIFQQKSLQGIIQCINNGTLPNSPHQYWPWGTLWKALQQTQQCLATKNLWIFNASVKLGRRTWVIDDHKRLMMIISSGDMMHVDVVMQAGLRRNMSISALVSLFAKAAAGGYAAKSFMEHEVQLGILFLQLGGNRLTSIAHKALGTPGVSMLQHS